jgi:hypothetical protein
MRGLLVLALLIGTPAAAAEDWLLGRWAPDWTAPGRGPDVLEFRRGGDVINIWPDGTQVEGFYILTHRGVKAVFTHRGQDLITTFHGGAASGELRIVTHPSGRETVYRRIETPPDGG